MRSILVAIRDPGQRRQLAIRKAARLAADSGARLTLFHAFSMPLPVATPMPADPVAIIEDMARRRRAQLQSLARPLRARGLKVSCETAWDFPAAHAIVRRVLEAKHDLVVAESHRHARLARLFLANADWDLIRECPCPVWFVKKERFAARPLLLAAIDPTHAHAKPSSLDDRLVQAAGALARELGGRLSLLHVTDTTQYVTAGIMALPLRIAARARPADPPTRRAIRRLAARHGLPESACLVRSGIPATVLTQSAKALKADVLVMGAISRSGLSQSFIGSTAEAVIDEVGCDVLIVKPRSFRTSVPRRHPSLAGRKSGR